jgi:hypothetical protein
MSSSIDYDYYGPLWRLRKPVPVRLGPCRGCPYTSPSTACTWCRQMPVMHPDGSLRPLEGVSYA